MCKQKYFFYNVKPRDSHKNRKKPTFYQKYRGFTKPRCFLCLPLGFRRDFPDGGILKEHFQTFFLEGKAGSQMADMVFKCVLIFYLTGRLGLRQYLARSSFFYFVSTFLLIDLWKQTHNKFLYLPINIRSLVQSIARSAASLNWWE